MLTICQTIVVTLSFMRIEISRKIFTCCFSIQSSIEASSSASSAKTTSTPLIKKQKRSMEKESEPDEKDERRNSGSNTAIEVNNSNV